MTLQWTAVAFLLYTELAITLLLLIPFLRPATWKKVFNLPFFGSIRRVWTTFFYATLLILIVLFADSIRTMLKYGAELKVNKPMTLDSKLDFRLNECRGQRNFYISGFTLFLILVIHRLVSLIYQRAQLEAETVALKKQAIQANKELARRIDEDAKREKEGVIAKGKVIEKPAPTTEDAEDSEDRTEETQETTGPSQADYDRIFIELKQAQVNLEAMKRQAESTNTEYDRLTEEHQKLQVKLQELEGSLEDKKDQ